MRRRETVLFLVVRLELGGVGLGRPETPRAIGVEAALGQTPAVQDEETLSRGGDVPVPYTPSTPTDAPTSLLPRHE